MENNIKQDGLIIRVPITHQPTLFDGSVVDDCDVHGPDDTEIDYIQQAFHDRFGVDVGALLTC